MTGRPDTPTLRALPRLVRRAVALVWASSPRTFLGATALQIAAGAALAMQLLVGREALAALLASAGGGGAPGTIVPYLVILALLSTATAFATQAQTAMQRMLTERTIRYGSGLLHEVATSVDLEAFESPEFFDRLRRAAGRAIATPISVSMTLTSLGGAVFSVAGIAVALVTIHPALAPMVVAGYVPLFIVSRINSRVMYEFSFGNTPRDRAMHYVGGFMTGREPAKEVRAFGLAEFLQHRWQGFYDERIAEISRVVRGQLRRALVGSATSSMLGSATLGLIVVLLLQGRVTVASAATAAVAIQLLGSRLQSVSFGLGQIVEDSLYLEDLSAFLAMRPPAERDAAPAAAPFGSLQVENVTFTYPGAPAPALRDLSMRIAAGEIVALVGENGSGKTTLAKLLSQLYRPSAGRILWDGIDTATLDPAALRAATAVIFQDFLRYQLPARDNVAAGRPEAADDLAAVVEAARRAGADEFLGALPRGYDTMLSKEWEGGADLSAGQWQRVALARAFFRDAPFIVLDEPTASLDPRAEAELFESIRTLMSGRTVLLISHRFSSVRSADRIYVLEEGRVIENGSHLELMQLGGTYAELFTLQASAYAEEASPHVAR